MGPTLYFQGRPTGNDLAYDEGHNYEVLEEYSDSFVHWVNYGETLSH